MPIEPAADLVLRGGAVHTVDDARPTRRGGRRAGGPDRGGRLGRGRGWADRPADAGHRAPRPDACCRGSRTSTSTPARRGSTLLRCDLHASPRRGRRLSRHDRGVRRRAIRTSPGSSAAAGTWPTSRTGRRIGEDLDAVVGDRPASSQNRDGHAAWVSSRALELAGDRRVDTRPGRWPDRARRRRDAERDAPRGGDGPRRATSSRRRPGGERGRDLARAQAYLHSLGMTGLAGRDRRALDCQAAYLAMAGRGRDHRPGRRGACPVRGRLGHRAIEERIERRAEGRSAGSPRRR